MGSAQANHIAAIIKDATKSNLKNFKHIFTDSFIQN